MITSGNLCPTVAESVLLRCIVGGIVVSRTYFIHLGKSCWKSLTVSKQKAHHFCEDFLANSHASKHQTLHTSRTDSLIFALPPAVRATTTLCSQPQPHRVPLSWNISRNKDQNLCDASHHMPFEICPHRDSHTPR
jgi:hypothetical protein